MKIYTYGEVLLRLTSKEHEKLFQSNILETSFCGSELNVSVDLSLLQEKTAFLTSVPKNDVTSAFIRELKKYDVDTSYINILNKGRFGTYYLEIGSNQRASRVIYDREYSSFVLGNIEQFDLNFSESWFHTSGISLALTNDSAETLIEIIKHVKANFNIVSMDLNYRSSLWKYGSTPHEKFSKVVNALDYIFGNEEDFVKCLNLDLDFDECIDKERYSLICNSLFKLYPNLKGIGISLRESITADNNKWSGMFATKEKIFFSKQYEINDIVDRVGSGDSFSAGIIYGIINNFSGQEIIDFATAYSCLKHSIKGDYNLVSKEDTLKLLNSSSTRIDR